MSNQPAIPGQTALRIVLALSGLFILYTGLNVALGGFVTLGWHLGPAPLAVVPTDLAYKLQDSHIRFFGGVWVFIGVVFALGARDPLRYQATLRLLGGLARFSQQPLALLWGPKLLGSVLAELVGIPVLYWWLGRTKAH
jgi:hypothetical protein